MAGMSDYLENKLVDHIFRSLAYAIPIGLHVSLHKADPTDVGITTQEFSGGNYARAPLAPTASNWANTQNSGTGPSSGTSGATTNNAAIVFPTPSADWGTATHFGVWDSSTGGNMLFSGQLQYPKTVNTADVVSFPVSTLAVTFS